MAMCFAYPRFPTERQPRLLHAQRLGWRSHLRVRSPHHVFGCSKRFFLIKLFLFCFFCEGVIMKKCLFKMAVPSKPPPNTRMRAKATEASASLAGLRIAPVHSRDVNRLSVEMMPVSWYTVCKYTGRYIFKGEVVFLNVTPAALMMTMIFEGLLFIFSECQWRAACKYHFHIWSEYCWTTSVKRKWPDYISPQNHTEKVRMYILFWGGTFFLFVVFFASWHNSALWSNWH